MNIKSKEERRKKRKKERRKERKRERKKERNKKEIKKERMKVCRGAHNEPSSLGPQNSSYVPMSLLS